MTTAWWTASHLFLPCSWSMDAFCFCAALHILEFIKDFLRLVDILRILHFFPPDWFMNCDYFKSFNDDFLCQLPKKKQNERALKAISWLRKKKISVVSSNLLSMLYSREIQIKTREKWLEAKQSIKCIEYLKYFEVYGCGRIRKSIFIVFATSEEIYQRIRRKKIKNVFLLIRRGSEIWIYDESRSFNNFAEIGDHWLFFNGEEILEFTTESEY